MLILFEILCLRLLTTAIFLIALLTGCGNKSDLYLPDQKPNNNQSSQSIVPP